MPITDNWEFLPEPKIEVSPETLAEIRRLYAEAFAVYGSLALWNARQLAEPSAAEALVITQALRTHGGMAGRRHAERIETLCHAGQ